MKIIIYGSKYGTAKKYAEELAKQSNIKTESFENIKSIDEYETIIYVGALYAGGVLGMAKIFKNIWQYGNSDVVDSIHSHYNILQIQHIGFLK